MFAEKESLIANSLYQKIFTDCQKGYKFNILMLLVLVNTVTFILTCFQDLAGFDDNVLVFSNLFECRRVGGSGTDGC